MGVDCGATVLLLKRLMLSHPLPRTDTFGSQQFGCGSVVDSSTNFDFTNN